jgi:hypothetical protein
MEESISVTTIPLNNFIEFNPEGNAIANFTYFI